jgi:hypothetical protein
VRRADAARERAGWAAYWDYSAPEKLAGTSDNAILALTPTLGIDQDNRLMSAKRQPGKGERGA